MSELKWLGGTGLWYQKDGSELWINQTYDHPTQFIVRRRFALRKIRQVAGPFDTLEQAKVALIMLRSTE